VLRGHHSFGLHRFAGNHGGLRIRRGRTGEQRGCHRAEDRGLAELCHQFLLAVLLHSVGNAVARDAVPMRIAAGFPVNDGAARGQKIIRVMNCLGGFGLLSFYRRRRIPGIEMAAISIALAKFFVWRDSEIDISVGDSDSRGAWMILKAMFGLSLVLNVSLDAQTPPASDPAGWLQISVRQKDAALLPLVRRATDCILHKVAGDPRYSRTMHPGDINDLIVDSVAACGRTVRAMIDAHDCMYGKGSGEAFLLGPYLDVLPSAVVRQVKVKMPGR
jgi:hypothetical protein